MINAKVHKDHGDTIEAEKTLKRALELAKNEFDPNKKNQGSKGSKRIGFSSTDLATIYLELSECMRVQNKDQESNRIMQEGMSRFQVNCFLARKFKF